jgi:hypothetical protein
MSMRSPVAKDANSKKQTRGNPLAMVSLHRVRVFFIRILLQLLEKEYSYQGSQDKLREMSGRLR